MLNSLKYYLELPYDVHIETHIVEGKNVYYAHIEELGKHACYGKGSTREKALRSLDETKKNIISYLLKKGKAIPNPAPRIDEDLPSGNFVVRTNPHLHQQIAEQAKSLGISLNLYVNQLLARNVLFEEVKNYFDPQFDKIHNCLEKQKPDSNVLRINYEGEIIEGESVEIIKSNYRIKIEPIESPLRVKRFRETG
ncbi:hypothetical protein AMJ80_04980 [bacterium SM23_31]|nr:MAG: hypothetical protein AMJ80_04980 [bacterium SM23_31]